MFHNTGITSAPADATALSVEGPQPVWKTLNEARERAFTGEIVFDLDPEVHAYLDHGIVYYAERRSDAPLGRRLLEAGVLDAAQLERGTVRVGDVEHLGRLFDRDPSVERDAVVVVAEGFTQDLITELANGAVASVRVTAYRHHPSGLHRWFVAPFEAAGQQRPVSAISQIDTFAIDELPVLPFSDLDDELTIEWDEPLDRLDGRDDDLDAFDGDAAERGMQSVDTGDSGYPADVFELSLELAGYVDDVTDEDTIDLVVQDDTMVQGELDDVVENESDTTAQDEADAVVGDVADQGVTVDDAADAAADMGRWVGEEAAPTGGDVEWLDADADVDEDAADRDQIDDRFELVWPGAVETSSVSTDDAASVEFDMPPLMLGDGVADDASSIDEADEVSDDVAEAVRRAIAAIESASVAAAAPTVDELGDDWDSFEVFGESSVAATTTDALPVVAPEMPSPSPTLGFAPPTMDMRAEVLYQQSSDHESAMIADEAPAASTGGGSSERTSALRRLIGGLRRAER